MVVGCCSLVVYDVLGAPCLAQYPEPSFFVFLLPLFQCFHGPGVPLPVELAARKRWRALQYANGGLGHNALGSNTRALVYNYVCNLATFQCSFHWRGRTWHQLDLLVQLKHINFYVKSWMAAGVDVRNIPVQRQFKLTPISSISSQLSHTSTSSWAAMLTDWL